MKIRVEIFFDLYVALTQVNKNITCDSGMWPVAVKNKAIHSFVLAKSFESQFRAERDKRV